jgi:hypothetical protein
VLYDVYGDGNIVVTSTLIPGGSQLPEIPEIGMLCTVPAELSRVTWYGRGPYENYWDRKTGSNVGIHTTTIDSMFNAYIRPQETGNRTDVRWMCLTDNSGAGLLAVGMPLMEFNALPYTPLELESKKHPYELVKNSSTILRLNYHQMGMGGDNSWGMRPHPEFTLYSDSVYTYRFRLLPIHPSQSAMSMSKKSFPAPQMTTVPNMMNLLHTTADSLITALGLTIGNVSQALSSSIPLDHVISQNPPAGSLVPLGIPVNLVISLGIAEDVALAKAASASSEETSKGNTANKGNDGSTTTRWCASDGSLSQWWKVDLGKTYDLAGTEVMWEFAGSLYGYRIDVSANNVAWTMAVNKTNNTSTAQTQADLFTAKSVRYVRITITGLTAGSWASFWEFGVFASLPDVGVHGENEIPFEMRLDQNYPNPFNPATKISYSLPRVGTVSLKIFDVMGREIAALVHNEKKQAGNYEVSFDAAYLPSGIYFYRLRTEEFVETKKMVLIK